MERTPLNDEHRKLGAVLTDFHGWEMPIRYRGIPEEHLHVRSSSGLFDLSHMGRVEVRGADAGAWLDRVLTNDFAAIPPGRARYTLILNEAGTIIDDAIVYRLPALTLLVVNASNRAAVIAWMEEHRGQLDAELVDRSAQWAMVSIQGPASVDILSRVVDSLDADLELMKYYSIAAGKLLGGPAWVARTGYTGEDGFEVYLDAGDAARLWTRLLEVGGERILPVGLGARDTLRLEAGMPLYGNDIDATTDPWEAGLDFAVKLEKGPFLGREALIQRREQGPARRLCGFKVEGRRIARQGMDVRRAGEVVGRITSGAPSPTLQCPIAMGYLESELASAAPRDLRVDIRGHQEALALQPLPFFSRTRQKRPKRAEGR